MDTIPIEAPVEVQRNTTTQSRVPAVLTPAGARIRDTAARMMSDQGVASVSMRDLAKELGMQAPSIYSHFESQGALIAAVCEPYTNAIARLLDGPQLSLGSFLDAWRKVIQWNLFGARIVHCDPAVLDVSPGLTGRIQDLTIATRLEKYGIRDVLCAPLIALFRSPFMVPTEMVDDRAVTAAGELILDVARQAVAA